jgi:hypothetical protein
MSFLLPILGSLIGGAGSIISGTEQANAANNAANLQAQSAANSLAFQKQEFNTNQTNQAPWLQAGGQALSELSGLTNTPGQGLLQGFDQQFQAPTAGQAAQYPGYQFQLQQGQNAVQNSAAAKGGLVSGNSATALNNYSQQAGQSDYNNVYNEAMQQYLNSYNIFNSNQANQYNRLAGIAGTGQTAATTLGQQGQQAAGNVAGINATAGQQIGQNINNAGAATASGYAGATNAAMGGINNYQNSQLLASLLGGQAQPQSGGLFQTTTNNADNYG